jgi:hypothetical protein
MTNLCLFGVYENKACTYMTNDDDNFVSHLINKHYDNEHAMNWLNGDETIDQLRSNTTDIVEMHNDGFTVNTKLMEPCIEYGFVYEGTEMVVKLTEGGDLQVFSE